MRWVVFVALFGCRSDSKPASAPEPKPASSDRAPVHKPPDEMDERMRHCPLALEGAVATLSDIEGGVRFTVKVPEASVAEVRRRANHLVEFAAKKTREGHGEFDGKGGGHMKNCPVVTDQVTITATEIVGGAQLDVVGAPDQVEALRVESRDRASKFPFVGATITIAAKP